MKKKLLQLKQEILKRLEEGITEEDLLTLRAKYLGRKGEFTQMLRSIKDLAEEERREFGRLANDIKCEIEARFHAMANRLKEATGTREKTVFDATLPGKHVAQGSLHPVTQMTRHIWKTFSDLNFSVIFGPELETDFYNFQALNIPKEHPARDMQATFYLSGSYLLRTHTSPMQIRYMEKHEPPFQVIITGKCYRRDSDMRHVPMFHQFEGLMVGVDVTLEHLKNILTAAIRKVFEQVIEVRFRSSYFPFVEPGAEFDVTCTICEGKGCATCSFTGWVELGGCGMVHPEVFRSAGKDPKRWQGFAFGFGIERVFMMKHRVNDIRLLYENDLRFLKQF